jgi:hypothetical protein
MIAALCDSHGVSIHEKFCSALYAKLDQAMSKDSVAVLRGRQFTVKRSSGVLESDWQLVFGAQVQVDHDDDEEDEDVVTCYQASSCTSRLVTVTSHQHCNANLFQTLSSSVSAAYSTAQIPPPLSS